MQTQSYAMQPCKLYFSVNWESEIWRGRQRGGAEKTRQGKKKGKVGKTPAGDKKNCGGGGRGSITTTTDSTMSSDVQSAQSLCRRGAPARVEPSSPAVRRRARER